MIFIRSFSFILIIAGTLIGCATDTYVKSDNISSGWPYEKVLTFSVPAESKSSDELELVIDHSINYAYQNLYLIISSTNSESSMKDTIDIQMSDKKGYWLGDCNQEDCTLNLKLQDILKHQPPYQMDIQQHSRDIKLLGINSIGIRY